MHVTLAAQQDQVHMTQLLQPKGMKVGVNCHAVNICFKGSSDVSHTASQMPE